MKNVLLMQEEGKMHVDCWHGNDGPPCMTHRETFQIRQIQIQLMNIVIMVIVEFEFRVMHIELYRWLV